MTWKWCKGSRTRLCASIEVRFGSRKGAAIDEWFFYDSKSFVSALSCSRRHAHHGIRLPADRFLSRFAQNDLSWLDLAGNCGGGGVFHLLVAANWDSA